MEELDVIKYYSEDRYGPRRFKNNKIRLARNQTEDILYDVFNDNGYIILDFLNGDFIDACKLGYLERVDAFIESEHKCDYFTGLMYACREGYVNIAKILINNGREILGNYGHLILYEACKNGHIEIVKLLIKERIFSFPYGFKGFIDACKNGHIEIVQLLMKVYRISENDYNIGLDVTNHNDHKKLVKYLKSCKVNVNDNIMDERINILSDFTYYRTKYEYYGELV